MFLSTRRSDCAVHVKPPREGYDVKLFLFAHDVRPSHIRDSPTELLTADPNPMFRAILYVGMDHDLALSRCNDHRHDMSGTRYYAHGPVTSRNEHFQAESGFDPLSFRRPTRPRRSRSRDSTAFAPTRNRSRQLLRTHVRPNAITARPSIGHPTKRQVL
jgi:hypothetical protein